MANRDTHDAIGLAAGLAATLISALSQGREPSPLELLGGAVGGLVGARGPDTIEPAHHPHHRQFAHSAALLLGGGAGVVPASRKAQNDLAQAAEIETDPFARAVKQFASGATVGLPAGYASHVVADATTPRGIPLVGRFGAR
jgi:hypothetical protein